MAPSNNSLGNRRIVWLDRAAIAGLAFGLALYVMPLWREGRLRWALLVTLFSTLLHVYTSHERGDAEPAETRDGP